MKQTQFTLNRRSILLGAGAVSGTAALTAWFPAWAQSTSAGIFADLPSTNGPDIALRIARQTMQIDGKPFRAIGLNGTVPGRLLRLRQGQNCVFR